MQKKTKNAEAFRKSHYKIRLSIELGDAKAKLIYNVSQLLSFNDGEFAAVNGEFADDGI